MGRLRQLVWTVGPVLAELGFNPEPPLCPPRPAGAPQGEHHEDGGHGGPAQPTRPVPGA